MKKKFFLFLSGFFLAATAFAVPDHLDQLTASNPQFSAEILHKESKQVFLSAIATVQNNAPEAATDIVLEARFLDASGKVLDVITSYDYGVTIPAGREALIKVKDQSAATSAPIASVQVRVISAEFKCKNSSDCNKNQKTPWLELLANWGPMLLLIGVWIFFIRRSSLPKNYYARVLEQMEKQTQLMEKRIQMLENASPRTTD